MGTVCSEMNGLGNLACPLLRLGIMMSNKSTGSHSASLIRRSQKMPPDDSVITKRDCTENCSRKGDGVK